MFSPVCYLNDQDLEDANAMAQQRLRVGYVPEHFSTPIHFAQEYYGLNAELIAFPSGTGHMITALRSGEIDVGIGLTEGWVAGLGKGTEADIGDGGYRLVGTYVETPLCWAISTGARRPEITSVDSLKGSRIGVSRIGSGSYVMGFVLADERYWLVPTATTEAGGTSAPPFSDFVVLDTFERLRRAVNEGDADFFMWEHFTSKRYYDSGEIRRVGEIYTPWSSWKIVASTALVGSGEDGGLDARVEDLLEKLNLGIRHFEENKEEAVKYISTELDYSEEDLLEKLNLGIRHFEENKEEAVKYISTELDYSEEDAREWLKTVRFPQRTQGVSREVIERVVEVLRKAGVLAEKFGMQPITMIAKAR